MTTNTKKFWAWVRRQKPNSSLFVNDFGTPGHGGSEVIISSSDKDVEMWLFDDVEGEPRQPRLKSGVAGAYIKISKGSDGDACLSIYISRSDMLFPEIGSAARGLLVYEGPLASTEDDLLEHWGKLVAERLTKEN